MANNSVQAEDSSSTWGRRLKAAVATVLIVVGCLALASYVVVHWAERQILTTDNWVALVSPLPKQPVVSTALGSYISTQIFSSGQVEAKITDALPPKASFLAGPLTDQLQGLTTKVSQKVVASDGFQTVWEGANRITMNRLLAKARGQTPPLQQKVEERFNIDLSGSSGQLRNALGKASTAIPALQPDTQQAIGVSTDLKAKAARVHQVVRTIDKLAVLLPLIATAAYLGSMALVRQRRRTTAIFAVSIFVLMLIELIALKWLRQQTLDQVKNAANIGAVGYIFDALVGWLKHMIYLVIALSIVLTTMLWLAGPAEWAARLRGDVRLDRVKQSGVMTWWRGARLWFQKYEYYGWLAAGVLVLIGLAVAGSVTATALTNAILLALSLFALLHIVATPPYGEATAPPSK